MCMYACMYVYVYVYIYTRTHIGIYAYDSCIGSVVADRVEEDNDRAYSMGHFISLYPQDGGDECLVCNGLGEGSIWVCNYNDNLENGVCMHACMYVCRYVHTYVCVCVRTYVRTCLYVRERTLCVNMYVCMCVCIHTFASVYTFSVREV
jgi:hypothetical protein